MKNLFKKSARYVFGVMFFAPIIIIANSSEPAKNINSTQRITTVSNKAVVANSSLIPFSELPCGFKMLGMQSPHKPSFITSNDIPVLQYPAGNHPGTNIQIPDALYSDGQNDQLILQADGNLVIYCTSCTPSKPIWSAQTNGKGAKVLYFQTDGDLVLRNASNKVVWHSNIKSTCAGSELAYYVLQEDGNLVMLYNQTVAQGNDTNTVAAYLGGSGSTNTSEKWPHPGKIQ